MAFCLAAALFDFPPAPGFAAPDLAAPQAWLLLFKKKHTTRGVYRGLFRSCKSGRVWVLEMAPKARLTLDLTEAQETDAFAAQLAAARDALVLRGSAPTHLRVTRGAGADSDAECDADSDAASDAECDAKCAAIPSIFVGIQAVITHLEMIDYGSDAPCEAYAELLQQLGPLLPHLTTLTLQPAFALPPPNLLPQLTTLHLTFDPESPTESGDECFISSAAYLPQLIQLTVDTVEQQIPEYPQWDLLLNPDSTTA